MSFVFTQKEIDQISELFELEPKQIDSKAWMWELVNVKARQTLTLTIYGEIDLGDDENGSLVSVQTLHGNFELHDCSGFITFEPDELIFASSSGRRVSALIVSKNCACSMYSNLREELLNADFSNLDPALILSAMQASLVEGVLI